jgi:hypothetical protein
MRFALRNWPHLVCTIKRLRSIGEVIKTFGDLQELLPQFGTSCGPGALTGIDCAPS